MMRGGLLMFLNCGILMVNGVPWYLSDD